MILQNTTNESKLKFSSQGYRVIIIVICSLSGNVCEEVCGGELKTCQ